MNQKSLSLSVSSFITNENKALLWSVLHGGGKFSGIPDKQLHNIQEMFELTIREMSEHYRRLNQPTDLSIMNKEAVIVMCKKIESVKMQQSQQQQRQPHQNPPHQQIYQKKQQQIPQLETIYRAEDLQKERQNAFQNEFKRKEEEMSSILKLKKPEEINFTDDVYDKPIGNDMERLLAEALASRERELEQIKNVVFHTPETDSSHIVSNSVSNLNKNKEQFVTYKMPDVDVEKAISVNVKESEKHVSFGNELHIIENQNEMYENEYDENNNVNNDDVSFIFNKLKKIKTRKTVLDENVAYTNADTILQMSQDITCIKTTLAELVLKLNNMCNQESSLPLSS
jgi:hypothetical protein